MAEVAASVKALISRTGHLELTVILTLALAAPAAAQRRGSIQTSPGCVGGINALFDEIEFVALTDDEAAALAYLREEEKLARDVYLTLADTWQLPIFANIAGGN